MSYAIYGESLAYVHLVSAPTAQEALRLFLEDVKGVCLRLSYVGNIYAVCGTDEATELEDEINALIKEDELLD